MKDLFDGIGMNVKITGDVKIDVKIDSDMFMCLPASVQKEIVRQAYREGKE